MSYETEEQQVERLKEWWSENGTPLIVGAILGLAGFAGWKFWNQQQVVYQEAASDQYNQVVEILQSEDKKGFEETAQTLKSEYADSTYAIYAAFQLAKKAVEDKQLDKAAAELNWVIENHSGNELLPVAKIRLARILVEQGKAEEALPLVTLEEDSGFYALASLVKGDALVVLQRKDEALKAYKAASTDSEIAQRHPSLQLKIDQLSAAPVVTLASPATEEAQTEEKASEETQKAVQESGETK